MIPKIEEKKKAVALRKAGKTYSEILSVVSVAKSTLSLWFLEVNLAKPQKQKLTQKRIAAQKRGAEARQKQRIESTQKIIIQAKKDIENLSKQELRLIGTALYWAEGSKAKKLRPSSGLDFGNSDPRMIKLYIKWLIDIVLVTRDRIKLSLYVHETAKCRVKDIKNNWSQVTGFPESAITYVYYKKHNPKTVRKNTGDSYWGLLRIRVSRSTDLNRKVMGWIEGICDNIN